MRQRSILVLSVAFSLSLGCERKPPDGEGAQATLSAEPVAKGPTSVPSHGPSSTPPRQLTRPTEPLNVLYLSIDAMRADMPWQGYSRPIAPNLTKLANEGVVYEEFRSIASYTAQSVATMLSGQHASTLYRNGQFFTQYHASNTWITETMQAKGIKTAGVQAHLYFDKGKNIDQGFEIWKMVPGITFDSETDNNVTSDKAAGMIREILSDPGFTKQQWFLWSHFTDPHDQYVRHEMCPKEWGKKNRDRYDCEIYFVDHHVGKLLEWARTQPWWARTALVISADHGEAFGEHGQYKHAFRLWDVLLRVPAIFVVPGATAKRIRARRTHIDFAPTILDLMALEPLSQFEGKTMVPEIFGTSPENREPIVLELTEDTNNPHYRAVIQGDYKLIAEGGGNGWNHELYDLAKDPGEEHDLADREPAKLAEMKTVFQSAFAKVPSVEPYGGSKLHSGRMARGPIGPDQDPKRRAK